MVRESMRGADHQQNHIFSYVSPEQRVRNDHPLRSIRTMVDEVLTQMSPVFDAMYAEGGRPSIPPEKLLRAQLLQMLYSIRSERLLMEEIDYSILFRWFVGLNLDDEPWNATVFTKNRDRLMEADVAKEFLAQVVERARAQGLTSDEHFTVDGTLLEAWASLKSFQRKDSKDEPPKDDPGNPTVNFHGEERRNDTHESTTDPEAECRNLHVTPHVALNDKRPGGSAFDARTTRHSGYAVSQKKRKRIEECFGWLKTIALLRKLRHRGVCKVDWIFTFACAVYNLVRMRNLGVAVLPA